MIRCLDGAQTHVTVLYKNGDKNRKFVKEVKPRGLQEVEAVNAVVLIRH
jgi:hypothetical protein